jgi:hypothetical protein
MNSLACNYILNPLSKLVSKNSVWRQVPRCDTVARTVRCPTAISGDRTAPVSADAHILWRHATQCLAIYPRYIPCVKANRSYLIVRVYPVCAVCAVVLQTVLEHYLVIVVCRPCIIRAFRTPASYYAGPSSVPRWNMCDILNSMMQGQFGCE